MDNLSPAILLRITTHLDAHSLKALRSTNRRLRSTHLKPLHHPISSAQYLATEIVHEIYSYITNPCTFDAARQTCSRWFQASFHAALLTKQIRNLKTSEKRSPLSVWEEEYVALARRIADEKKVARAFNLRLASTDPTRKALIPVPGDVATANGDGADADAQWERMQRMVNVLVSHVKLMTPTWRVAHVERCVLDLSMGETAAGTDARWVSPNGMFVLARNREGEVAVYSLYQPKLYLRNAYNKKASGQGKMDRIKETLLLLKTISVGARARILQPHDATPVRLVDLPYLKGQDLVDAVFLDTPTGCLTLQTQVVMLVKIGGKYALVAYNIETQDKQVETWTVSQSIHCKLETSSVEVFTVSPEIDLRTSKDDQSGEKMVYITLAGDGKLEHVTLSYQQGAAISSAADRNEASRRSSNKRTLHSFNILGRNAYESTHRLRPASWLTKEAIFPLTNNPADVKNVPPESEQPRAFLCLPYILTPENTIPEENAGIGIGYNRKACYNVKRLTTMPDSKIDVRLPLFEIMRWGTDIMRFGTTGQGTESTAKEDWSGLQTLRPLGDVEQADKKTDKKAYKKPVNKESEEPDTTLDLGWFGAVGVGAWEKLVHPGQTDETQSHGDQLNEMKQDIFITTYKLGPFPNRDPLSFDIDELNLNQICRLTAVTPSLAVHFASIAISGLGTYVAAIFQPGDEVWVWITPHIFGPPPMSATAENLKDRRKYSARLGSESSNTVVDPMAWPSLIGYFAEEGRKIGSVEGAMTLRWDWRPMIGDVISRLGSEAMMLHLVVGTSTGKVFMCDFYDKGHSWMSKVENKNPKDNVEARFVLVGREVQKV